MISLVTKNVDGNQIKRNTFRSNTTIRKLQLCGQKNRNKKQKYHIILLEASHKQGNSET